MDLIAGFLVMFMQAGFAMVETGFTRAKNVAHTMMMNFMVYVIGMTGYWIMGYALQMGGVGALSTLGGTGLLDHEFTISLFGKDFGLFGMKGFFLAGSSYDVGVFTMFLFQMVFMDTAATIPTGAMAERWKFSSFVVFAFFLSMISYPLFANWVWGGGWLSQLGKNFGLGHGHVDFAGSSVVHMVGGVTALAGAMVLGRASASSTRTARPIRSRDTTSRWASSAASSWPSAGSGSTPGSSLAGTDLRIAVIAVNTMLASRGRDRGDVLHVGPLREARSEHVGERVSRRSRRDHGAVRLRVVLLGVRDRRRRGLLLCWAVFFVEHARRWTIRSARSPCMESTGRGAS